jgi:hypothetical protein
MAVADLAALDKIKVMDASGKALPITAIARGGPPWSLTLTLPNLGAGAYRLEAWRKDKLVACRKLTVGGRNLQANRALAWNRGTEDLFSAWIEQLFDAPLEEDVSYSALDPLLRDPAKNFLYNHLGLGEDDRLSATPDCADMPYFLRAYFAWKMGLPSSYRACGRGSGGTPPRCGAPSLLEASTAQSFFSLSRRLMDAVHSASARTGHDDSATDFYPVTLTRESLRPGTIYADPYGHILMIVKWVPQTKERGGQLLAVDAQPDNSIGRKRFWEGTFLFANDVPSAGPGFKAFRPLARSDGDALDGGLQQLSNAALRNDLRFAAFSNEQDRLSPEDFYARMGKLINPQGLDPAQAYEEMLNALVEQLETRIKSVDNGEDYQRGRGGSVITMPEGAAIFQTTGPWEDFATPSRDQRLIIALNTLEGLPKRITRHPELFVLGKRSAQEVRAEVEKLHERRIQERSINYTRSDGIRQSLAVADILARKSALEMAYNPNDCVEIRWGASAGSPEHASCRRNAPSAQRAKMEQYRSWFREGRRPSR